MTWQKRRLRPSGFILITVVTMVAVSGLLLGTLAVHSVRIASTAVSEHQRLQTRWAAISIRRFALQAPWDALAKPDANPSTDPARPSRIEKEGLLAGRRWRIVISDESAKVNLLALTRQAGLEQVLPAVEDLVGPDSNLHFDSQPAPNTVRWEHWLRPSDARASQIAAATDRVTLWGNGKLNVTSADEPTIHALWRILFGTPAPDRLIEMARRQPVPNTRELISLLALRESQRNVAQRFITTESSCRGVWVFCLSDKKVPATFFVQWGESRERSEFRGYEY